MSDVFSLLDLLAELSIALLGFIAVFSVFARQDGKFSAADKHFVQAMVFDSVSVTGFAILANFLKAALEPAQLWFVCAVAFVIVGTLIMVFIAIDQAQMPKDESQKIHVLWHVGAWASALLAGLAVIAAIFGYWSYQLGFVAALCLIFANALYCFVAIVFRRFF